MRAEEAQPTAAPRCDFVGGAMGHRLRSGFGRHQPLARAVGLRPGRIPRVIDATAGLGRDAFLLASLGLDVTLIERSPEVHTALADGLRRAAEAGPSFQAIVRRMTLIHGDARDHLERLRPDVVVVDPMHPPRTKTALVKKDMRLVRSLVGVDEDAFDLLLAALRWAANRVVLKWPPRASLPAGLPPPHHTLAGKTIRYDVFLTGPGTRSKPATNLLPCDLSSATRSNDAGAKST